MVIHMTQKTFVINLITGEQRVYKAEPVEAVKQAFVEENNLQTEYIARRGHLRLPIVDGKRIVSCGHWTAKKVEQYEYCC